MNYIGRSTYEFMANSSLHFAKRATSSWFLDFHVCQDITIDQDGIEKACKAFVSDLGAVKCIPLTDGINKKVRMETPAENKLSCVRL